MEGLLAEECEAMRKSTDTYEHTINGLLQKRKEIIEEMASVRERLGLLANDVEAIDRVLQRLGYDGSLEMNPHVPRFVLFYRGQLREWLANQLRERGPATSSVLAGRLVDLQHKDKNDKRLMQDITSRIGSALRHMQAARLVEAKQLTKRGENTWSLQQN
jgi:chorismate mutase